MADCESTRVRECLKSTGTKLVPSSFRDRFGTGLVRKPTVEHALGESRQTGLTLVEVMVYVAVLAILGAPLTMLVLVSTRATSEHDAMNRVAERNRTALYRVKQELRTSLLSSVNVQNSGGSLSFTLASGFNGTAIVPGDTIRYDFVPVPGEASESRLVRRNLDTGEAVVICHGIDSAESNFALNGTTVTINVTNTGELPRSSASYTVSKSLTVEPRN